jgi:hypothetical protein
MPGNLAMARTRSRQEQETRNPHRIPLEALVGDEPGKPDLLVELPQRCLDRDELGLHLDDQKVRSRSMEREQIEGAALPVARIADLRRDLPAEPPEKLDRSSHEVGVGFIQETIDDACSRANVVANDLQIEPLRDLAQAIERDMIRETALDEGDQSPAYAAAGSEI